MPDDNTASYLALAAGSINTTAQNISKIQDYYDEQGNDQLARLMAWYNSYITQRNQKNRFVDHMAALRRAGINPYSVTSSGDLQAISGAVDIGKDLYPKGQAPADFTINAESLINARLAEAQIRNLDSATAKNNANEEYYKVLSGLKTLDLLLNQDRNNTYLQSGYWSEMMRLLAANAGNAVNQELISADDVKVRQETYEDRVRAIGLRDDELQKRIDLLVENAKTQKSLQSHYKTLDDYTNAQKDLAVQKKEFEDAVAQWRKDIIENGAENSRNDLEIQGKIITKLQKDLEFLETSQQLSILKAVTTFLKIFM